MTAVAPDPAEPVEPDVVEPDRSDDTPGIVERTRRWTAGVIDTLLVRRRPAWSIALMRIVFGVTLLAWTVSLMVDADDFFARDGLVPPAAGASDVWRYVQLDTLTGAWVALAVLTIAAIAITVGFRPTWFLLVAFVLLVAIQRRNPLILNSGDLVLRNFALLLALCPTSAALSVDRWLRYGRAALRTAPLVAPWGLRLIQLQVMVIYFFAFWSKYGETWRQGTAVSTALRLDDLRRIAPPGFMIENIYVVAALTWGALAIELALALLLWHRGLRPVLIVLALLLHLLIDAFMLVGFFFPALIVGLCAFADPEWVGRVLTRSRRRPAPA